MYQPYKYKGLMGNTFAIPNASRIISRVHRRLQGDNYTVLFRVPISETLFYSEFRIPIISIENLLPV